MKPTAVRYSACCRSIGPIYRRHCARSEVNIGRKRPLVTSASTAACSNTSAAITGTTTTTTSVLLLPTPPSLTDFDHHKPGVARLNHASFGATPAPVLAVQDTFRQSWLAQPDEWYFTGKLHHDLQQAAVVAGRMLVDDVDMNDADVNDAGSNSATTSSPLPHHEICLVENATVAACAVAFRWRDKIKPGDVVVCFDIAYKACIHVLKEYCERQAGATLVQFHIPFFETIISKQDILDSLRQQFQLLAAAGIRPKFAFLDHVSSQPAVLLPMKEIIALVREFGCNSNNSSGGVEVCVDGAHAIGSVPDLHIPDLDCDFYFSNFHKWGFGPSTATVLWSRVLPQMKHPVVSWAWGQGMAIESLFPGTRDFSAMMAVPAAVEYLETWTSSHSANAAAAAADGGGGDDDDDEVDGMILNSQQYCHKHVLQAAAKLRDDWGTDHLLSTVEADLVATQAMVRLPPDLVVADAPGQVSRGVRDVLRDEYHIEAAVGNFENHGAYLRLSYAVYNTHEEIQRLSDAVIDIIEKQKVK